MNVFVHRAVYGDPNMPTEIFWVALDGEECCKTFNHVTWVITLRQFEADFAHLQLKKNHVILPWDAEMSRDLSLPDDSLVAPNARL